MIHNCVFKISLLGILTLTMFGGGQARAQSASGSGSLNAFQTTMPTNQDIKFQSPLERDPSLLNCHVCTDFDHVTMGIHHFIATRTSAQCANQRRNDIYENFGYTGSYDRQFAERIFVEPKLGTRHLITRLCDAQAAQGLKMAADISNEYLDAYGRSRAVLTFRFALLTPVMGRPCANTAWKIDHALKKNFR